MEEIFKRNNINTIKPATPEEKEKWIQNIRQTQSCYRSLDITHIYSTADIKYKWLENNPFENIKTQTEHIFIVPNKRFQYF